MQRVDGRHSRWDAHRVRRRRALVESALRAIRRYGAGVTLDDVATVAGTSKTVLYRYFGDRVGLYHGVVDRVSENILGDLLPRLTESARRGVAAIVHELVDSYTALVERDPEIYRFVMNRPSGAPEAHDPVASIEARVATALSDTLSDHRARRGLERVAGSSGPPATTGSRLRSTAGYVRDRTWWQRCRPCSGPAARPSTSCTRRCP